MTTQTWAPAAAPPETLEWGPLTEAGFALPGVETITICHDPRNEASAGIPAQLGYTRLPDLVPGPPGREDERHVCWSLREADWVPVRG